MRAVRVRCAVVVALCCSWMELVASSPAMAQPAAQPAAPAPAGQDAAKKFYEQGRLASQRNQWEKARAAYLEAWKLKRHWQIAINLAQAEMKVGQFRDAAEHLTYFLREATDVKEDDRKAAQTMFAEARTHIGELTVVANQEGAEIFVDEVSVGKAPLESPVFVAPGPHVVEARLEGFPDAKEARVVGAGAGATFELKLVKPVPIQRPVEAPKVVHAGPKREVIIAGIAATVVLAGAGLGFAMASKTASDESHGLEDPNNPCPGLSSDDCRHRFKDLQSSKVTFAGLAMCTLIGAGAIGVGTNLYTVIATPSRPKDGAASRVTVGVRGTAVTVAAQW